MWAAIEVLKAQGKLDVMSVKNRFRGKATATGYRDINMSIKFEGHVCEIQIQLAAILEIKHDQVAHARRARLRVICYPQRTGHEPRAMTNEPATVHIQPTAYSTDCITAVYPSLQTPAYELIRSLELEEELEEETSLANLSRACSPATRLVLGLLRFGTAVTSSIISVGYLVFGLLYDTEESKWVGAVSSGVLHIGSLIHR